MIEDERYTEMLVQHFSINPDIYGNVGKLLKQHLNLWLFSNPGDTFLILNLFMCIFCLFLKIYQHLSQERLSINVHKEKYFVLVKKVIKMSESVKKEI